MTSDHKSWRATILDADNPADRRTLTELSADPQVEIIDSWAQQDAGARQIQPLPGYDATAERMRWAYYPWRRTIISVLGPQAFRTVRLNRNRNMITSDEQERLSALRIGVVGLSVGSIIAQMIAAEGLCGELRLSDFDSLELANLNRVPATVFDLNTNKAIVAARRIAETDPYLPVEVLTAGVTPDTVGEFLDGLDIVVEECDSLDTKVLLRERARKLGIPVLMATSDRGLVDIERFDLEPERPVLHGLLHDVDTARLSALTSKQKVPYVLRILDAGHLSPRGAASLVEVGHTLSTWPQLAGDVALGASAVTAAIRRIGLGEPLSSGRVRIDVAAALDRLDEPEVPEPVTAASDDDDPPLIDELPADNPAERIAAAAIRAPSGGNAQPWILTSSESSLTVRLAAGLTSTMDVRLRASAVAVGAAVFNARVAASANAMLGPVEFIENDDHPLQAIVHLHERTDPELTALYKPMLLRETNRHRGQPRPISEGTTSRLESSARREGARVRLLRDRETIRSAASVLAAADRIRYLTPRLHADMMSELRWPGDGSPDSGIDVRSLELEPADLVTLDILRRGDVMALLELWNGGSGLGVDTFDRVCASAGLAVVTVSGRTLTDYAIGGSAVESVWIEANQHGLAVQPISPVFLYAQSDDELHNLSPAFAASLRDLQERFRAIAKTGPDESQVLVLRLFDGPPTSVRSRRRVLNGPAASYDNHPIIGEKVAKQS